MTHASGAVRWTRCKMTACGERPADEKSVVKLVDGVMGCSWPVDSTLHDWCGTVWLTLPQFLWWVLAPWFEHDHRVINDKVWIFVAANGRNRGLTAYVPLLSCGYHSKTHLSSFPELQLSIIWYFLCFHSFVRNDHCMKLAGVVRLFITSCGLEYTSTHRFANLHLCANIFPIIYCGVTADFLHN